MAQAYLFARLGVRLLFYASQTEVYLTLTRPAPPAPPAQGAGTIEPGGWVPEEEP